MTEHEQPGYKPWSKKQHEEMAQGYLRRYNKSQFLHEKMLRAAEMTTEQAEEALRRIFDEDPSPEEIKAMTMAEYQQYKDHLLGALHVEAVDDDSWKRMCVWCGVLCGDEASLDEHEAGCESA